MRTLPARRVLVALLGAGALLAGGGLVASVPPASAQVLGDALLAGQQLAAGDLVRSPGGRYALSVRADGALVLEEAANRLRPTARTTLIAKGPPGSVLALQADGNLVLYGPGGVVRTDFRTSGTGAQRLAVQDDGNLVLYGPAGVVLDFGTDRGSFLRPGDVLLPGDQVRSPDGSTTLVMQLDGNLVLYQAGRALFQTGTAGQPGAAAVQQDDGNLVVYSAAPVRPLFATGTSVAAGDDVELDVLTGQVEVVRSSDGPTALWGSAWSSDTVAPGQVLYPGDRRGSPGGRCVLIAQADGNLVDYCAGAAVWWTRTSGPLFATMTTGGDFQVFTAGDAPAFTTRTSGFPGSRLVVQTDGNVVVYTPQDRPVFSAR